MKFVTLSLGNSFRQQTQIRGLVKSILCSQEKPEIIILCDQPVSFDFLKPECIQFKVIKEPCMEPFYLKLRIVKYVEPPFLFTDADCLVAGEIPFTDLDICVSAVKYLRPDIYDRSTEKIKETFKIGTMLHFNSGTVLVNNLRAAAVYDRARELRDNVDVAEWWTEDEPYMCVALAQLHEAGAIRVSYMDYMTTSWDLYHPDIKGKALHHYYQSKETPLESNLIWRLCDISDQFNRKFPELIYQ